MKSISKIVVAVVLLLSVGVSNAKNKNVTTTQENNPLQSVFNAYFEVKDALVKTDSNIASVKATALLTAINDVKMDKLDKDAHTVWMKVVSSLKEDAEHIAATKDVKQQRENFITLSKNIYDVIKVSKLAAPTYYQFCPMANGGKGANWLSKESAVKNPYFGNRMLTCGKIVETIK